MVRSIVTVTFKDGAGQREREKAIEAIGGVVVGGINRPPFSEYFVRIRGTNIEAIFDALDILRSRPEVQSAFPVTIDPRDR